MEKKSQHVFMVQTLHKVGIEGMCLSLVKAGYGKPTANITLNGKKAKALSEIRNKTKMPTPATFIPHCVFSCSLLEIN